LAGRTNGYYLIPFYDHSLIRLYRRGCHGYEVGMNECSVPIETLSKVILRHNNLSKT